MSMFSTLQRPFALCGGGAATDTTSLCHHERSECSNFSLPPPLPILFSTSWEPGKPKPQNNGFQCSRFSTTSFVKWNKQTLIMYNTMLTILLFATLFVNRILLNENYSPFINSGFFYLLFCKDLEQELFHKHMYPILSPYSGMSSKVLDFGSGPGIMSVFF